MFLKALLNSESDQESVDEGEQRLCLIVGAAGSGKTALLKGLLKIVWFDNDLKISLCSQWIIAVEAEARQQNQLHVMSARGGEVRILSLFVYIIIICL